VRIIWLLEELGVPYELETLEFTPEVLKGEAHRRVHPLGQIPAIIDGDVHMIESGAILEYLLETYGSGRLAPAPGSRERPAYLQWFHYGEATLARHVGEIVRNRFGKPESRRIPAIADDARERFREALALVERAIAGGPYILGEAFTAADIMLSYGITMARVVGELPPEATHVAAYLARLKERPGYQRAWA
jgi:glutathione S-transferase